MTILISIAFFLLGIILGSFYNVVGYRLPRNQSLIKPRSHCPNCNHNLAPIELIPIFSFLIQGGKCRKCKQKISWFYTTFEFLTGILFVLSYMSFGFSINLVIALLFVSMAIIVIISDYQTFIISDEVLIFFSIAILIAVFFRGGINDFFNSSINGIISFIIMFIIKKIGDFIFKKESMGGGDIKLMFVLGVVLGFDTALISIFLASIIGLPISIIILHYKHTNIIPFGPFLCVGALILLLYQINFIDILKIIS
ncbi:MAG: prepilin peptidase [Bacilli bacterium]